MRHKILSAIVAILIVCFILSPLQVTASFSAKEEYVLGSDYIAAKYAPRFGETTILLKRGFDFINTGSSSVNWELALTGVALSDRVYNGTSAEELLKDLGYEKTKTTTPLGSDSNRIFHPVSSMGYKRITDSSGKGKNVFAVIVRGTANFFGADGITDLYDGAYSMFDTSRGNVADDLKKFITEATGKSIDELKDEDNYFFFGGHSLGGAVANALSVDETVTSLCNSNKEHIYTYTYESPHTCVNLWWMDVEGMSNAYNIKDVDDAVTNVAPYIGATTYGKDMVFSVNDLDNSIFVKVFPNANGVSVTHAPHPQNYGDIFGHHDLGLCLVYIMQHGIADGWWDHVHKIDEYISMWTKDEIMVKKSNIDWSSLYYNYIKGNNYSIKFGDEWYQKIDLESYTPLALYDFDIDGIPEMIIGQPDGTIIYETFTIYEGKVVYAGTCGRKDCFFSDKESCPGLFSDMTYHGVAGDQSPPHVLMYSELSKGKIVQKQVVSYKNEYSILNNDLYNVYLECTSSNENNIWRKPKNSLQFYNWSDIQANGWESFLRFYGYLGGQNLSDQSNQYERFNLTLGGTRFSIELPSNWHAKTTTSDTGEDMTFSVTETNGRDYTVCTLRAMTVTEYERVKEWYESWGTSIEDATEYYGKQGKYYYAMVWLDGYGYDSSTQLIIDNALRISHDVAKTFQFCE